MNKEFQELSFLTSLIDQIAVFTSLLVLRVLAGSSFGGMFWYECVLILGIATRLCFGAFGLYTKWLNEQFKTLCLRLCVAGLPILTLLAVLAYQTLRARVHLVVLVAVSQAVLFALGRSAVWTIYWIANGRQKLLVISKYRTRGLDLATWLIERQRLRFAKFRVASQGKRLESEMESLIHWADVVLLDGEVEAKEHILSLCAMEGKHVEELPTLANVLQPSVTPGKYGEKLTLTRAPLRLSPVQNATKRAFDILFSLGALAGLAPIMAAVSIAVKLSSPGPVFYRQQRVGLAGKQYGVVKFRTMVDRAEASTGPVMAQMFDPRITRLGRFLRATRLDETPQFINVLLGDMSVVGPRPERLFFEEIFEAENPLYTLRHNVKPGITGLAQVMGNYSTDAKDKLKLDLLYIQRYSWLMDARILFETIIVMLLMVQAKGVASQSREGVMSPKPAMTMDDVSIALNERN